MGAKVKFRTAPVYSRVMGHRDSGWLRTPLFRERDDATGQSRARLGEGFTLIRSRWFARLQGLIFSLGLLVTLTCLMPGPAPAQSHLEQNKPNPATPPPDIQTMMSDFPDSRRPDRSDSSLPLGAKQKQSIMRANFQKAKSDAASFALRPRNFMRN